MDNSRSRRKVWRTGLLAAVALAALAGPVSAQDCRGRIVGSEYWSKIYLVLDAARYNRTDVPTRV